MEHEQLNLKVVDFFIRESKPSLKELIHEAVAIDKKVKIKRMNALDAVRRDMEEEWSPPIVPIEQLLMMPERSLGREYALYLLKMNQDQEPIHSMPSSARFEIKHPIKKEAYIRDRIRQTHDIIHILTNFNTSQQGEMGIQGFYIGQKTTLLSLLFAIQNVSEYFSGERCDGYIRAMVEGINLGLKAKKNCAFVRHEESFEKSVELAREELNITPTHGNAWNIT